MLGGATEGLFAAKERYQMRRKNVCPVPVQCRFLRSKDKKHTHLVRSMLSKNMLPKLAVVVS